MEKELKTLICCIAKMENNYIREWVEWYKNIGVTNICIFDNNDIDGECFEDVIGDYIDNGFVILKNVRGLKSNENINMQTKSYQDCYDEYCNKYDWIGFFDADEYLEIENNDDISVFLKDEKFKTAEAIRVCWKNYDDSGLIETPNDYSINRFRTLVNPDGIENRISKVLIKGGMNNVVIYQKPGGEHGQFLNCVTLDCNGRLHNNNSFVLCDRVWKGAWLRHYRFKTINEYVNLKLKRLYPNVNEKTARNWLSLKDFFEYNEVTPAKLDFYEKATGINSVICFIFNYNKDENASRWYSLLNNYFKVCILDTYHLEHGTHFICNNQEKVIELNNIYVGGLTIKSYEIAKKENYQWVMIVNSDVQCDDENFIKLINSITEVRIHNNIGVWEPSALPGSMCDGATMVLPTNRHLYNNKTNSMRNVVRGEGWFEFVKVEIMDNIIPFLNYEENKYGWGINDAFCRASKKMGQRVVIDDRVCMYHPFGTGYDNLKALEECKNFKMKFDKMGIGDLKTLLCCIGRLENQYIREYVEYYKNLGITNICLFDNNYDSEENFRDVINDYIENGFVILKDYRNRKVCQLDAYNECYQEYGDKYDWIAFFDIDEFMFIHENNTISDYLSMKEFDNYDMIHINWQLFGDGDVLKNDGRQLLQRIVKPLDINIQTQYNFPDNFHIKSIIRGGLKNIVWNCTPHTPTNSIRCCNASGEECTSNSPFTPYDFRKAGLLHFTTKTAEEFAIKVKRGFPDGNPTTKEQMIESFFKRNKVTKEKIQIFKDVLGIDMSYLLPYEGEKNKDIQIFSLCYSKKNFKFLNDSVITPLQVGAANGTNVCELKDNIGDNISDKNYFYIENTGTYWIWKNVNDAKYKGQMQYRRPLEGVDENMNFNEVFSKYKVITCEPFNHPANSQPTKENPMFIPAMTVEQGYTFSNCIDDLKIIEMVINIYHPEYKESYAKYIKQGENLYYSNGFIMRSEDYDRYCEFLFDCLDKYQQFVDVSTPQRLRDRVVYNMEVGKYPKHMRPDSRTDEGIRWQMSIGGFLSERIWTLWLLHNFKDEEILKLPYNKMEENMYT